MRYELKDTTEIIEVPVQKLQKKEIAPPVLAVPKPKPKPPKEEPKPKPIKEEDISDKIATYIKGAI